MRVVSNETGCQIVANKEKRGERYRYLVTLGFNTVDARKLRDRSGKNIEIAIRQRRLNLQKIPTQERSESEKKNLAGVRRAQRETRTSREGKILSETDRADRFSLWSGFEGFPSDALNIIQAINDERGEDENDSFGYRMYYHIYVERMDIDEAERFTEERDT